MAFVPVIHCEIIAIPKDQMLSMFTNPVSLLQCPSDQDICILQVLAYFIPGPTNTPYVFSGNENILVGWDTIPPSQARIYDGDYLQMTATGFVDQTSRNVQPLWEAVLGSGSFQTPGSGLFLTTQNSNLTAGDGALLIYVYHTLAQQP